MGGVFQVQGPGWYPQVATQLFESRFNLANTIAELQRFYDQMAYNAALNNQSDLYFYYKNLSNNYGRWFGVNPQGLPSFGLNPNQSTAIGESQQNQFKEDTQRIRSLQKLREDPEYSKKLNTTIDGILKDPKFGMYLYMNLDHFKSPNDIAGLVTDMANKKLLGEKTILDEMDENWGKFQSFFDYLKTLRAQESQQTKESQGLGSSGVQVNPSESTETKNTEEEFQFGEEEEE